MLLTMAQARYWKPRRAKQKQILSRVQPSLKKMKNIKVKKMKNVNENSRKLKEPQGIQRDPLETLKTKAH